ncbi:MAG: glutamine-hydrolyzing carbamoyl-phosphate synthase small subunit [Porticoccaceae bacterium]|nr:glutamine-hydrolyzing carbamoyl-phosphate synthase small subunit [Porticoccaceae bacterium]
MNQLARPPAILALADGSIFRGKAIGAEAMTSGEVVFNTAMTGYQEILTDPSYARQIVTLTYPHIGNVGVNSEDEESAALWAAGLVIRDLPLTISNFRSEQSLDAYLKQHNVVAIADIDTRRLTRILREKGAQSGAIVAGYTDAEDAESAVLDAARNFAGLAGLDLAKEVSTKKSYEWTAGSWQLAARLQPAPKHAEKKAENLTETKTQNKNLNKNESPEQAAAPYRIVAYDYGVKRNILRMLVDRGCEVTVVPAQTPASAVLAMQPDGVFLSNGPGDPEPCDYAISAIHTLLETDIPLFGICLGHQLLALASGASTEKMKFGHHGANHPVQNLDDQTVLITSQNHGFAVDESSLPSTLRATHRSLFDDSLQGIARTDKPAFSFQGHPEASPGPHDATLLFDHFIELMTLYRANGSLPSS